MRVFHSGHVQNCVPSLSNLPDTHQHSTQAESMPGNATGTCDTAGYSYCCSIAWFTCCHLFLYSQYHSVSRLVWLGTNLPFGLLQWI